MINQPTPFIFVYSKNDIDLDKYHNMISRVSLYGRYVKLLYRGSITPFDFDDYVISSVDILRLFAINNGVESNMIVDINGAIKNEIQSLKTSIALGINDEMVLSLYHYDTSTLHIETQIK